MHISNKEFFNLIIEYQDKKKSNPEHKPPDILIKIIMLLVKKLAASYKFKNSYQYLDDLMSDGIFYCWKYMDNFNRDESENPFSFFTQIAYTAFLRKIEKEKSSRETISNLAQRKLDIGEFYCTIKNGKKVVKAFHRISEDCEPKETAMESILDKIEEKKIVRIWEDCIVIPKSENILINFL